MDTFGERLAKLRKGQGFTQTELSKRLRLSKSRLAMYEINLREPDFETLIIIADYFDVSLDYLILGKDK